MPETALPELGIQAYRGLPCVAAEVSLLDVRKLRALNFTGALVEAAEMGLAENRASGLDPSPRAWPHGGHERFLQLSST